MTMNTEKLRHRPHEVSAKKHKRCDDTETEKSLSCAMFNP